MAGSRFEQMHIFQHVLHVVCVVEDLDLTRGIARDISRMFTAKLHQLLLATFAKRVTKTMIH